MPLSVLSDASMTTLPLFRRLWFVAWEEVAWLVRRCLLSVLFSALAVAGCPPLAVRTSLPSVKLFDSEAKAIFSIPPD